MNDRDKVAEVLKSTGYLTSGEAYEVADALVAEGVGVKETTNSEQENLRRNGAPGPLKPKRAPLPEPVPEPQKINPYLEKEKELENRKES